MSVSRIDESRQKVRAAMMISYGAYIEQEAKKEDTWVDQNIWQLTQHLSHEVVEIKRSKSLTHQIHNAMDACSLSAILLAKLLDEKKQIDQT